MIGQKDLIGSFLQCKRIAVIGVSRTEKDFSRTLWKEFRARGFDAIPVNPLQEEIDGTRCFPHVQDITPGVEAALILLPKSQTLGIVSDCVSAGVKTVWLYGIRGEKDVDPAALEFCRNNGIDVIAGFCPFMFLPETSFFHRFHGFGWKLIGYYPK